MGIIPKVPKLNLSIQLVGALACALFLGNKMPETLQSVFYSISLNLKGLLLFILPVIIFSCLFSCLLAFRGKTAIGFMLLLFSIVCFSNYLSTLMAYLVSSFELTPSLVRGVNDQAILETSELISLWNLEFPQWLPNEYALYLGFSLGTFFSFFPNRHVIQFNAQTKRLVTLFLEKIFLPILPLFAFGFILKMQHDGILTQVMGSYVSLIILTLVTYTVYLGLLFALAAHFNFRQWLGYLKNILPVALTGFSTMSSLATMPMTIKAAEKNTGSIDVARAIIPATVNVHMIGVSIGIPLMALSILASFGYELPHFTNYCIFALYFILAQFAVGGIPGGAILVMLPILETKLGFTSEMSATITALYILFDPIVTATNVLGNSALVIMVSKLLKKWIIPTPTHTDKVPLHP